MGDVTATTFASTAPPFGMVLHVQGAPLSSTTPGTSYNDVTEKDGGWTRFVTLDPKGTTYRTGFGSYTEELARHESYWQKLWQDADIQIEGDPESQQLVHKLMFDLLQSTHPGASDSIAPESLSGDFYKGHIFWDADIWMFPALLAQHPDYARSILDYRFNHLAEAKAQAKAAGYAGADFPWESASSGKEVAPSGFSKGRHVTADVGWAHWQYWLATQDKEWLKTRGWPVLSAIADFWASRAKKNEKTGKWDVLDVYGPDELKTETNNNTYTNAMARYCLLAATGAAKIVGQPSNPKWKTVAENIALPFNKKGGYYMAREDDDNKPTKQADGELVIYPAALPMDRKTAETTFTFQSKRPIKNGPAMTDAMHALIAARLGRQAEAEQAFRDSYRPFIRGPFLLFSEKRSLDRCVFTTGAGGVLQAVIYGFGGLDLTKPSGMIDGKPTLPTSWKKLTITGIKRGGKRYTLTVTPEKRTLTVQS
jgi:trehalose/maltose hydrolase-like predicted phosphorylase